MADPAPSAERLGGWKSVAAYLNRSVRTVQRWELECGLPIRRVQGTGAVIAYRHEIDVWRESARGRNALAEATHTARLQNALASLRGSSVPANGGHAPPPAGSEVDDAMATTSTGRARSAHRWSHSAAAIFGLAAVVALSTAFSWRWRQTADITLVCPGDCTVRQGQTLVLRSDGAGPTDTFVRSIQARNGRVESFKPALAPDAGGTITWGFTTDCSSAPGSYGLRLVHETSDRPTNVVQVRIAPNASCATPVADLVAEGVSVDPAVLRPAQLVTYRFSLRNQGAVRAPASIARLRLGTSPDRTAVTDRMLADVSAPAIDVAESIALEGVFHLPDALTPGVPYYVWVVADNGSAVLERVSVNNFARSTALIVSSLAPP